MRVEKNKSKKNRKCFFFQNFYPIVCSGYQGFGLKVLTGSIFLPNFMREKTPTASILTVHAFSQFFFKQNRKKPV